MKNLFLIFLILAPFAAFAQHKNLPLSREAFIYTAEELNEMRSDTVIHTSFKPIIESGYLSLPRYVYNNSWLYSRTNAHRDRQYKTRPGSAPNKEYIKKDHRNGASPAAGYLVRKLKSESFIWIQTDESGKGDEGSLSLNLTIDPLFNLEAGKSNLAAEDSFLLYRNTRGLLVRGDIGKRFSFESTFYENQAVYTEYIKTFVDSLGVAPGQGRVKKFKSNGYDFAMSSGYISYSPSRHFNFQFGHGKHFVGDGYRSLLLSDNAFNYPYIRVTSTFNKFQYVNLYTAFMNLTAGSVHTPPHTERLFQKKAGAFQMLNYSPHRLIQLGIFQGMIWETADNKNRQHLNAWYFNPVIGLSAIPYGLDSKHNILLGATMSLKVTKGICIYSQFMMDDTAEDLVEGSLHNKTGWQAGFKAFNMFTLPNLYFQAEYNSVTPYSYSHRRPEQSYTHYSQTLAHPLGANFYEAVGILSYRLSDFFAEIKINYAKAGRDSAGYNFGIDPLASNNFAFYGANSTVNEHLQGLKTTIINKDFRIGYIINPVTNMNITLGMTLRDLESSAGTAGTKYYYAALRTSLSNIYYDF